MRTGSIGKRAAWEGAAAVYIARGKVRTMKLSNHWNVGSVRTAFFGSGKARAVRGIKSPECEESGRVKRRDKRGPDEAN